MHVNTRYINSTSWGGTSGGVDRPSIYTHTRWELPQATPVFALVLHSSRARELPCVLTLHERSGPRALSDWLKSGGWKEWQLTGSCPDFLFNTQATYLLPFIKLQRQKRVLLHMPAKLNGTKRKRTKTKLHQSGRDDKKQNVQLHCIYIALHCIDLHCTALYRSTLHCIV